MAESFPLVESRTCPMCGETITALARHCSYCGEQLDGTHQRERDSGYGWPAARLETYPAISTEGTILPRYIASALDNVISGILAVAAAKTIDGDVPLIQVPLFVGAYLGYYVLSEGATGRTPAKWFLGLVVVQFDGRPCTWRQAVIRTLYRLLEVN